MNTLLAATYLYQSCFYVLSHEFPSRNRYSSIPGRLSRRSSSIIPLHVACWHFVCSFLDQMKTKKNIKRIALFVVGALTLSLLPPAAVLMASPSRLQGTAKTAPPKLTEHQKQMISMFNNHVKDYLKQRQAVAKKLPKLSKDATPEQIDAYQKSFAEALRAMRAGTKQGYIFKPEFREFVRTIINTEFPPRDKAEIKEVILEADTKGVPLRVNYPYPETKELTQIPPTLLLKLPPLPKEVKYRFVGRHMLLVDTDNGLIVDYTLNALP